LGVIIFIEVLHSKIIKIRCSFHFFGTFGDPFQMKLINNGSMFIFR
jgi:hypothetical protein